MHIFLREPQNSKKHVKQHVCTILTFSEKASLSQPLGRQNVNSYVLLLACLDYDKGSRPRKSPSDALLLRDGRAHRVLVDSAGRLTVHGAAYERTLERRCL